MGVSCAHLLEFFLGSLLLIESRLLLGSASLQLQLGEKASFPSRGLSKPLNSTARSLGVTRRCSSRKGPLVFPFFLRFFFYSIISVLGSSFSGALGSFVKSSPHSAPPI